MTAQQLLSSFFHIHIHTLAVVEAVVAVVEHIRTMEVDNKMVVVEVEERIHRLLQPLGIGIRWLWRR